MFNFTKISNSQKITEKSLRTESPESKELNTITDKNLDRNNTDLNKVTEKQFSRSEKISQILEKVLNRNNGAFQKLRDNHVDNLSIPPINILVEKLRQDRNKELFINKTNKDWTTENTSKAQNGELPDWPQSRKQHTEISLNNDSRRFNNIKIDKGIISGDLEPLSGNITKKDITKIASSIKNGDSIDYDTAIVAILKQADSENRELNEIEKKQINSLKKERTQFLLNND